jgi:hypothetical protein
VSEALVEVLEAKRHVGTIMKDVTNVTVVLSLEEG